MIKKWLYQFILWFGRWETIYGVPKDLKKAIVIGAPHTSNWDFVYALPALYKMDVHSYRYLIKKEFFFWPFSWLFNSTGGIAVDRSKKNDLTADLKQMIESSEELYLLFPPEGTRSRVERWKTGFYYTALDTGLPIILGFMDFEKRQCGFGKVVYPTGDFNVDMDVIQEFYRGMKGKNPKNYNPEIYVPKAS